jgi:hypothetical protein
MPTGPIPVQIGVAAVCPLLSIASIRPPEKSTLSMIGPVREQEITPIACVGPACGVFVPHLSPTGEMIGGVCGFRLAASALAGIADSLERLGKTLGQPKN